MHHESKLKVYLSLLHLMLEHLVGLKQKLGLDLYLVGLASYHLVLYHLALYHHLPY